MQHTHFKLCLNSKSAVKAVASTPTMASNGQQARHLHTHLTNHASLQSLTNFRWGPVLLDMELTPTQHKPCATAACTVCANQCTQTSQTISQQHVLNNDTCQAHAQCVCTATKPTTASGMWQGGHCPPYYGSPHRPHPTPSHMLIRISGARHVATLLPTPPFTSQINRLNPSDTSRPHSGLSRGRPGGGGRVDTCAGLRTASCRWQGGHCPHHHHPHHPC